MDVAEGGLGDNGDVGGGLGVDLEGQDVADVALAVDVVQECCDDAALRKYPLDMGDIGHVAPGQLYPSDSRELSPGYYASNPFAHDVPAPPWGAPQRPIDIRDVIEVPPGAKAPWGYTEYLPGWFAPDRRCRDPVNKPFA